MVTSLEDRVLVASSQALLILVLVSSMACGRSPEQSVARGDSLAAQGKTQDALLLYKKASQRNPAFGLAYLRLGALEARRGEAQEAFLHLSRATFHIQTPYPGTQLHARMTREERMMTRDWNLYDTRHVVYRPAQLKPEELKAGYDWAYREFYRWRSIAQASLHHGTLKHQVKHFFYASGWKKFEPLWDLMICARQLTRVTPLLEAVLSRITRAKVEQREEANQSLGCALPQD